MKIMIVDDLQSNRMLLEKIIRRGFECEVISAVNGKEALDMLSAHVPDIILLDLMMPVMSGAELLQILRTTDAWKAIPVIVISATDDRDRIKEIALQGISGYILKPFLARDVESRIYEVLKNPR